MSWFYSCFSTLLRSAALPCRRAATYHLLLHSYQQMNQVLGILGWKVLCTCKVFVKISLWPGNTKDNRSVSSFSVLQKIKRNSSVSTWLLTPAASQRCPFFKPWQTSPLNPPVLGHGALVGAGTVCPSREGSLEQGRTCPVPPQARHSPCPCPGHAGVLPTLVWRQRGASVTA